MPAYQLKNSCTLGLQFVYYVAIVLRKHSPAREIFQQYAFMEALFVSTKKIISMLIFPGYIFFWYITFMFVQENAFYVSMLLKHYTLMSGFTSAQIGGNNRIMNIFFWYVLLLYISFASYSADHASIFSNKFSFIGKQSSTRMAGG
jgi:hypothetical protein